MRANCYKDDAGEVEDPMKPMLDQMVDMVVSALSGKAKEFYDREFGFFSEVTSISGKLKPYIKKSKPEKKVKFELERMTRSHAADALFLTRYFLHVLGQDRRGNGQDQGFRWSISPK